jgi:hypothetical protein
MYNKLDTNTLIYLVKCWDDVALKDSEMDYVDHYMLVVELNSRGVYEW